AGTKITDHDITATICSLPAKLYTAVIADVIALSCRQACYGDAAIRYVTFRRIGGERIYYRYDINRYLLRGCRTRTAVYRYRYRIGAAGGQAAAVDSRIFIRIAEPVRTAPIKRAAACRCRAAQLDIGSFTYCYCCLCCDSRNGVYFYCYGTATTNAAVNGCRCRIAAAIGK